MTAFTTLNRAEALALHKLVDGHCSALKNWMASAIERGDLEGAQKLVAELREHQALFAKLNVESHEEIERWKLEAVAKIAARAKKA